MAVDGVRRYDELFRDRGRRAPVTDESHDVLLDNLGTDQLREAAPPFWAISSGRGRDVHEGARPSPERVLRRMTGGVAGLLASVSLAFAGRLQRWSRRQVLTWIRVDGYGGGDAYFFLVEVSS